MPSDEALCEGVRILAKEAAERLPLRGLGVIQEDGAGRAARVAGARTDRRIGCAYRGQARGRRIPAILGRPPGGISRDARQVLIECRCPGNVRGAAERARSAAIICEGGLITTEHIAVGALVPPTAVEPAKTSPAPAATAVASIGDLESLERTLVEQALQNARFNKSKAAKALGLSRQQLYVRMRRHGLE